MNNAYFLLKPKHPLSSIVNNLKFEDYYKCIQDFTFKINENDKILIFDGKDNNNKENLKNRKCCICGLKSGEINIENKKISFKSIKQAHIIPAFFGNNTLFSLEECNVCNQKMGKLYEDDLGKMLSMHRLINQLPNRNKKYPKKKISDISRIEFDGNSFSIKEYVEDDFLSINEKSKEISLNIPIDKYNPINAIKSLIHSLWLVLNQTQRNKYKSILNWLENTIEIKPLTYIEGFSYNQKGLLKFTVWEKYVDNTDITDLILKFNFGNNFIMIELPNLDDNKYLPGILPPIRIPIEFPYQPSMTISVIENDQKIKPNRIFKFKYDTKIEEVSIDSQKKENNTRKIKKDKIPLMVQLKSSYKGNEIIIDYSFLYLNDDNKLIIIKNGNLACEIIMKCIPDNPTDVKINFFYDNFPIQIAKNTYLFLRNLIKGGTIEIKNLLTNKNISIPSFKQDDNFLLDDFYLDRFNSIETISNKYNIDLRYSKDYTEKDYKKIFYLSKAIELGKYNIPLKEIDIHVLKKEFDSFSKSILINNALKIETEFKNKIGKFNINLGKVKVIIHNPKILDKKKLFNNEKEYYNIKLGIDKIGYEFENFL